MPEPANPITELVERFVMITAVIESDLLNTESPDIEHLFRSRESCLVGIQSAVDSGASLTTKSRQQLAQAENSLQLVLARAQSEIRVEFSRASDEKRSRSVYSSQSPIQYELTG